MPSSAPSFPFRFNKTRTGQDAMMLDIHTALSEGRSIFINAPTGIGKTDASISACIAFASGKDIPIFFLTPKNSQHKVAVEVLSGLRQKYEWGIKYVDLVGKKNLCVNENVNLMEGEPFYKSCEKLMERKKCSYLNAARAAESIDRRLIEASMEGHNALFAESSIKGMCAYEVSTKIAKEADFIIADYAHVLNPFTLKAFANKIGHPIKGAILIWDEAHNIINTASSYLGTSLSTQLVERAAKEVSSINSSMDLGYLDYLMKSLSDSKLKNPNVSEVFIEKKDMPRLIPENTDEICAQLDDAGMEYINSAKAKRSALMQISRFIRSMSSQGDSNVIILSRRGKDLRLSSVCLYPADAIIAMKDAYANVFMSGTLLPLDMHKELLCFPDAVSANYQSPFPKENKLCLIDRSVSTEYTHRTLAQYKQIAQNITDIVANVAGNVAVFFPSFEVLNSVRRHMRYEVKFVQKSGMGSFQVEHMISGFKEGENNLLFAVMGGSLSEGIDYPNNIIKGIIIVGIPLEKPSLELMAKTDYLDKRFRMKGREYAYLIPGVVKAVQAAGRAIRSETDRAFIVLMDRRYSWRTYKSIIANFVQVEESDDCAKRIAAFMKAARASNMETSKT